MLHTKVGRNRVVLLAAASVFAILPLTARPLAAIDVVLENGLVVDGTGNAAFQADVAIQDGRIVAIGDLPPMPPALHVDVKGKVVVPGFIDMHSHADRGLTHADPQRRAAPNLITQGITTVVVNQDGRSPVPIRQQRETMTKLGVGLNVVQLVGHGTVRRQVMQDNFRRFATPDELDQMAQRVRSAMEEGAFGMSAGLEYVPGRWSNEAEMVRLVRELIPYKGVYVVHERSSGSRPMWYFPSQDPLRQPSMIDNIRELISIAEATGVNTVATHIKAKGVDFWGSSRIMIDMIGRARADGIPIYADQYPYNTSGTDGRIVLIPGWFPKRFEQEFGERGSRSPAEMLEMALENRSLKRDLRRDVLHEVMRRGGPEGVVVIDHPDPHLVGKSLAQLAAMHNESIADAAFRLQLEGDRERPGGAQLRGFSMSMRDVEAFARQGWTISSTDAGIAMPGDGPVHPRYYGSYPRRLARFVYQDKLMTLEQAVQRSTLLPAGVLGLTGRGVIKEGAIADLVVFDPAKIEDRATVFEPHQESVGMSHVMLGGEFVIRDGQKTGALVGRVLERNAIGKAE